MPQTPPDILARIEQAKKTRAKGLSLRYAGLTEIPKEIFGLDDMARLDLRGNQIRIISPGILRLTKLKWLDVRGNPLEQVADVYGLVLDHKQYESFKAKLTAENIVGLRLRLKNEKLPEFIFHLPNFTTLDLGGNQLTALPEAIAMLTNLTALDLGGNRLTTLPEAITKLTNLTALDLGGNRLTTLPEAITKLTNLTALDLGGNQLTALPEAICNLVYLKTLDLGGNRLTALPEAIITLTNLTTLDLGGNRLTALPEAIITLTNLTTLDLGGNRLTALSDAITTLTNLTTLDLGSNRLKALPEAIGNLTNLVTLNLGSTQLKALPEAITKLTNLIAFNLGNNQLLALPEAVVKLTSLKTLNLSANRLMALPEVISNLTTLTTLDLGGNRLTALSDAITTLTNLTTLDLGSNLLKALPEAIGNLTNLMRLNLSNNRLTALPETIRSLTNLTALNLDGNRLTALPEAIITLTNLTTLDLGNNQLTALPEGIRSLINLTTLNLSGIRLKALAEAITKLTNLTTLDLGNNQLTVLQEAIGKLTNLTTLNLSNNQLTALPVAITDLEKLRQLKLGNNPLEHPPKEIVAQGLEAIRNFLRQVREQGTAPLYEAKLLIVGEPGAGKTTLMKKLLDSNYQVPHEEDSTVGIQVHQGWAFPYTKDEKIVFSANLWDFGGQEIQYMTHQFFLTSRALYALVVDDRREERPALDYWFNIILLLAGPQTPVLVVLNENQHRSITNFDSRAYHEQFTDLRIETCDVDFAAENLNRVHVLRDKIRQMLCELPHIGDKLPAQWIPIRQELEAQRQRNHISVQEYFASCSHHGLQKESDQLQLSRYLHDLGIILHFQDDSRLVDMVIINPQWAADAVYAVLFDKTVQQGQGRFTRNWAFDLWQKKGYAYDERAKLLNLMLKDNFEICYKLSEADGGLYLAPQLLPDVAPEAAIEKLWRDINLLRFRFQYPFMPEGLITRLIVRLHEWIEKASGHDLVWKRGVIFTREGARARVTQEITRKEGLKVISIAVTGPVDRSTKETGRDSRQTQYEETYFARFKKELLTLIREEVLKIHKRSFPNIRFEQMIPCICLDCQRSEQPYFYEYSKLLKYERGGIPEVRCDQYVRNQINVKQLIEGVMEIGWEKHDLAEFDDEGERRGDVTINVFSEREVRGRASPPEPSQPTGVEDEARMQLVRIKNTLDKKSRYEARRTIWIGFGCIMFIWMLLVYFIYLFGWNTMEQWTWIVGSGAPIVEYAYFAFTLGEFSPKAIYERLFERRRKKNYADAGLENY